MKTTAFGLVVAAILTATGFAGELSPDLKAMQGNWVGSFVEINGKPPAEKDLALKISLIVDGASYKVYDKETLLAAGKLTLDTSKTPKTNDAVFGEGAAKGLVQQGIYQWKEGEILINFALPSKDRPKEFKTAAGSDETLLKYTRAKK